MANGDPEDVPVNLGPWLTDLHERSGLSFRGLARALGTDRTNVRTWQSGNGGMTAKNLLAYLDACGVRIEPPPPAESHSLAGDVARLRDRLEELAETVAEIADLQELIADSLGVVRVGDEQPGGRPSTHATGPTPKRSGEAKA